MGFHYGYEKRKFDAEWTRLEQEYRAAGIQHFRYLRNRVDNVCPALAVLPAVLL